MVTIRSIVVIKATRLFRLHQRRVHRKLRPRSQHLNEETVKTTSKCTYSDGAIDIDIIKYGDYDDDEEDLDPPPPPTHSTSSVEK